MDMRNVLGLILGGGQGSRLYPLTKERAKPAVPLAGKYRLIDIPMSNCFHAGIDKIAILTQFNSASLHRHIYRTYNRDVFAEGWIQILAAEQTPQSKDWFQGTADAVRKQAIEISSANTEYTLILSGDHLYRMDYADFADFHITSGADISIAVQPVTRADAPALGILKLDADSNIVRFHEKPKKEKDLDNLVSIEGDKPYMASMGIYMFKTSVLFDLLQGEGDDFGKEIIPQALTTHKLAGYQFDGFWADIGTIPSFFDVNLEITRTDPAFDFYDPKAPIYTRARFLPGNQLHHANLNRTLIADGCRIYGGSMHDCVLGLRSVVRNAVLRGVIMMGADYYESSTPEGTIPIGIGEGAHIDHAIVDKNARIGRNVHIRHIDDRPDEDHGNWVSRGGIVVIPKNAIILDGTII